MMFFLLPLGISTTLLGETDAQLSAHLRQLRLDGLGVAKRLEFDPPLSGGLRVMLSFATGKEGEVEAFFSGRSPNEVLIRNSAASYAIILAHEGKIVPFKPSERGDARLFEAEKDVSQVIVLQPSQQALQHEGLLLLEAERRAEAEVARKVVLADLRREAGILLPYLGGSSVDPHQLQTFFGHVADPRHKLEGKVIVFDLWAPWCIPCKLVEKELERLANKSEYAGSLIVISANIDPKPKYCRGPIVSEVDMESSVLWFDVLGPCGAKMRSLRHAWIQAVTGGPRGSYSLPFVVVISPDGKAQKTGARGLESAIQKAVRDAKQASP